MVMSHAKLGCISMATKLLLLAIILATVELPVTQAIGVCYGRNGDNLPSQQEVVALYKSNNIPRMRIYDPDQGTLEALRNSNIEVILGVPNSELGSIANDANAANSWVQKNVQNFWPSVKFRYIAVGNEVSPTNGESANVPFVLPAMRNIHSALSSAGLQNQIKVSTATYNGLVNPSFPPGDGAFDGAAQSFMSQIVGYLGSIGSPILVNVYPYFSFTGMAADKLSYALFTKTDVEFVDRVTGLSYRNLFDAIVDATYVALEKAGGPNLEIVISESGWPSAGGTGASVDNAKTYNQNLINHVKNGTPRSLEKLLRPTYLPCSMRTRSQVILLRRTLACSSQISNQPIPSISLKIFYSGVYTLQEC